MAMLVSDIGDLLRLTSWDDAHPLGFTDSAGAAADPTTVSLIVRKPDGTVTTYTLAGAQVVRDSIGKFYYLLAPDQSGDWYFEWHGTGAVQAASAGQFIVRDSKVAA
jgi:hypothetical protein